LLVLQSVLQSALLSTINP